MFIITAMPWAIAQWPVTGLNVCQSDFTFDCGLKARGGDPSTRWRSLRMTRKWEVFG
jgi:hypothetical protein